MNVANHSPFVRLLSLALLLGAGSSCAELFDAPDRSSPPPMEGPAPSTVDLVVDEQPDWLVRYSQPDPNVMFLVDRSGSMHESVCGNDSCESRWNALVALGPYLEEVKESARIGLALYPSSEGECGASDVIRIPISSDEDIDQQVMTVLQSTGPTGRTPTAAALDTLREQAGLADPDRDNIVVLLTDGGPNCKCEYRATACERAEVVESVRKLADQGVKLFVIGFGVEGGSPAEQTLRAMTDAAAAAFVVNEEFSTAPDYFSARSVEQLVQRLYTVSLQSRPCVFELQRPVDPDELVVSLDQEEVLACDGADCTRGYTYDETSLSVSFHGETCAYLQNGAPHELWFGDRQFMN